MVIRWLSRAKIFHDVTIGDSLHSVLDLTVFDNCPFPLTSRLLLSCRNSIAGERLLSSCMRRHFNKLDLIFIARMKAVGLRLKTLLLEERSGWLHIVVFVVLFNS